MTDEMTAQSETARFAWPVTLALATVGGSLAAACMMPFVALAIVSAATMRRSLALATILAIWVTNQVLGFTVLGYPHTGYAFAWGGALGIASILAMFAGATILGERDELSSFRTLGAFLVGFFIYEGALFGFALVVGGTEMFTMPIVGQILVNDALWFAGLSGGYWLLTRTVPTLFGPAPRIRFA
ncbi:MAG: hypothetical protein ABJF09_08925 [Qipengyuania citrea]|jgi:hypothetical protein|uniref:hypothetical protein n=1 Tax=Alphaproteobacteria TaxID=28211 RepID=UPI000C40B300|nr:hypothetical protein [Citromicrobium sp.]MBL4793748.1 hypothetical protein [Citromicrobium sp.]|tara:strand:+ start:101 stop:655 length:555 start_codon:yes stop_codon:yes gene_type:complete